MKTLRLKLKWFVTQTALVMGGYTRFAGQFFTWVRQKPFRSRQIFLQMNVIGVDSTPIILLVGFFTGAVFALQAGYSFRLFNAETMVGATVGLSLAREIAPVFAALMVIARVGSSMSAELGTMRVTEQIDALEAMAVNPYHYLVVPRVIASITMLPLLTVLFVFIGIVGSYIVGVGLLDIPEGPFLYRLEYYLEMKDLIGGLIKSGIFGFILAVISCYQGFNAHGGAKGVGLATTRAVVIASVSILITDYFLTQWILELTR